MHKHFSADFNSFLALMYFLMHFLKKVAQITCPYPLNIKQFLFDRICHVILKVLDKSCCLVMQKPKLSPTHLCRQAGGTVARWEVRWPCRERPTCASCTSSVSRPAAAVAAAAWCAQCLGYSAALALACTATYAPPALSHSVSPTLPPADNKHVRC